MPALERNFSNVPRQMASGGASGQPDYEGFWQGRAMAEALKKEQLASEQAQEALRKLKIENELKENVLDLIRGYGTPAQRQEELHGPRPGLSEALKSELSKEGSTQFSNVGGYQVGGKQIPSMRDVQPGAGISPDIQAGLMRKTLGLGEVPQESPEQRRSRELELAGEVAGRQEKHDVRLADRYAETQRKTEESRQFHDNKVGAFNLMEKYNTVVAQANTGYTQALRELHQNIGNPYYWMNSGFTETNFPKPGELLKAKLEHRRQAEAEIKARRDEQVETANMYKVLASNLSPEVARGLQVYGQPKELPTGRKVDPLRESLTEEEYNILTTNYGVTPELVEGEAQRLRVTTKEYVEMLKKAFYAQSAKKGGK